MLHKSILISRYINRCYAEYNRTATDFLPLFYTSHVEGKGNHLTISFLVFIENEFYIFLSNELVPKLNCHVSRIRKELSISQFHQLMDSSHSFTLFYR